MGDLVTIVIPFYNDPYVTHAIQSALSQTYPNVEVVLVNDGSTAYTHLLDPYRSLIRVIDKANGGTASALNEGIRQAKGRYIAWLSSDDRFHPRKLERQMAFMKTNRARISFTNFHRIDSTGRVIRTRAGRRFRSVIPFYEFFRKGNPINGCTIVAERDLLFELGLFDEEMLYTHDNDMWFKVLVNRIDFYYLDEALTEYRMHGSMGSVRFRPVVKQELVKLRTKYVPPLNRVIAALKREEARRRK